MDMKQNIAEFSDITRYNVLIVDDNPNNLKLLKATLFEEQYRVRAANGGIMALESIRLQHPDLILLDIQMPEMNGYEVCRQLKENNDTREIPVIFISALDDVDDIIKGFEAGGVDYIIKPFRDREVLARINTQLTIKVMQEKLQKQNNELLEAARLREDVDQITRHDLKGPLTPIISLPKIILRNGPLSKKQEKMLRVMEEAGLKMLNMINRSMDLFRMERNEYVLHPVPVDIVNIFRSIFNERLDELESARLLFTSELNGEPWSEKSTFFIQGEELLCYIMLDNLIRNAIEASSPGQKLTVSLIINKFCEIIVKNETAVPFNVRDTFFDKFATSGKKDGMGLGTYSARLSAVAQGGTIFMETSEEEGTRVIIKFPIV